MKRYFSSTLATVPELVCLDVGRHWWQSDPTEKSTYWLIKESGGDYSLKYTTKAARDTEYAQIQRLLTKGTNGMNIKDFADDFKSILPSPTQLVFFMVILFVLDKFIFGGSLRSYVLSLVPKKDVNSETANKEGVEE